MTVENVGTDKKLDISSITHPYFDSMSLYWQKWRETYTGGDEYVAKYLQKFSNREDDADFTDRKSITPCPAFAKAAVNDIKNSIYQRIADVIRIGGSESYKTAVSGLDGGVDLKGHNIEAFIGGKVLEELLIMSRVGIMVDMPRMKNPSVIGQKGVRPYLYYYRAEDIRSWSFSDEKPFQLKSVLLAETILQTDENFGLPNGEVEQFRFMQVIEDQVMYVLYNDKGQEIESEILDIPEIPFVLLEISTSLLIDVVGHQVALLNMCSSDVNYALKSNFPFYTEQYDSMTNSPYLKAATDETSTDDAPARDKTEVKVGAVHGRRYPKDTDRPGFIHPSSEPLMASMKKQEQLEQQIRQLVNLSLSNTKSRYASADSKQMDERGLESGLSYIGLALEFAENMIAHFWDMFEGKGIAEIRYPDKYTLKSDQEIQEEAKRLQDLIFSVPSRQYQREISKQIATITLKTKVTNETMDKILSEIETATVITADPETIVKDVENGLVSLNTASKARGYPEGEVDKAAKDHAARLKRIQEAQTPVDVGTSNNGAARGLPDLSADGNKGARDEKNQSRETTQDGTVTDKTRGEAQ